MAKKDDDGPGYHFHVRGTKELYDDLDFLRNGSLTCRRGPDRGTDLRTIQDYLGHRDPRHTVHYTRIAGRRFEGLWK